MKETFAYGLRSTARCWPAVFLFFALLMIPYVMGELYVGSVSSSLINWITAVTLVLVLLSLFLVYGLTVVLVRRLNPLPTQVASRDVSLFREFRPLAFSSLNSGMLSFVIYYLALIPLYYLLGGITIYTANSFWNVGHSLAWLVGVVVLAPLLVGFHHVILLATRRSLRGILEGFRLLGRRIWYPCVVLIVIWLVPALFNVAMRLLLLASISDEYRITPLVETLSWTSRVLGTALASVAFVLVAACFNKVYETLRAQSVRAVLPTSGLEYASSDPDSPDGVPPADMQ
ncbi:MAG: hypothetical protein V1748_02160 [Actinomycetota bacterium]